MPVLVTIYLYSILYLSSKLCFRLLVVMKLYRYKFCHFLKQSGTAVVPLVVSECVFSFACVCMHLLTLVYVLQFLQVFASTVQYSTVLYCICVFFINIKAGPHEWMELGTLATSTLSCCTVPGLIPSLCMHSYLIFIKMNVLFVFSLSSLSCYVCDFMYVFVYVFVCVATGV